MIQVESDKENTDLQVLVGGSQDEFNLRRFRNERKVSGRLRGVLEETRVLYRAEVAAHDASIEEFSQSLEKVNNDLQEIKTRNSVLLKENHNLKMKVSRFPGQKAMAVKRGVEKSQAEATAFQLKHKGVVTDDTRDMCLELLASGVPAAAVNSAIKTVSRHVGKEVKDSISAQTVGQVTTEGGIAAEIQIMDKIQSSKSKFFSFWSGMGNFIWM